MKKRFTLPLIILSLAVIPLGFTFQNWAPGGTRGFAEPLAAFTSHPSDSRKLLIASESRLYETLQDGGWKNITSIPAAHLEIRRLDSFKELPGEYIFSTTSGVFSWNWQMDSWKKIFAGTEGKGSAYGFAVDPQNTAHWFSAAETGLFETSNSGVSWFPVSLFRGKTVPLVQISGSLFAGTCDALYKSSDLKRFDKILTVKNSSEDFEETNDPEEDKSLCSVHLLYSADQRMWLATSSGVFESSDRGSSWQKMTDSGMLDRDIYYLLNDEKANVLYAASEDSVYKFSGGKWTELFGGRVKDVIKGLFIKEESDKRFLVTVSESGFYQYPLLPDQVTAAQISFTDSAQKNLFRELLRLEPSVQEVQNAAVRHANLRNRKTRSWQWSSRLSALLPTFSVGKDFSRDNNIDIDRGGTSDADRFIQGPEDIGRNWNMDVSWHLADFIYSSNQTSIDSREKIMVEFRNDIVTEITRLYYERRRLQMDSFYQPSADEQEYFEKILRIDELTGVLDGLTGGYFSKRLARIYEEKPGLANAYSDPSPVSRDSK